MTSKERLMTALTGGKPDRLPVSLHQWQGYHLDKYLGGITPQEAFRKFGMDAQVQYFQSMGQFWLVDADFSKVNTKEWIDEVDVVSGDPDNRIAHHTITTPDGVLTYKTAGDRKTTWITEYLIKRDEDVETIRRYMPAPELELEPIAAAHDEVGDEGILRGFVWGDQAGCWQHACCLMDITRLIMRCIDEPDWVHNLLGVLLEKKLGFVESMKGAKFDLIETGGGSASSSVISPKLHEEFCLPYDRKIHDALHEYGFLITYHTCGGTYGLADMIVDNHADVSETLAPPSLGGNIEPWDFAKEIAGRMALIGGMDQFNVVTDGPPEKIRAMVHKLFETVGRDGGYVCSMSDHFFETPLEHLWAFAEAGQECTY